MELRDDGMELMEHRVDSHYSMLLGFFLCFSRDEESTKWS